MRVSDYSHSQFLLNELNRTSQAETKTQKQIATGKKAEYFKELTEQTGVLLSAKQVLDKNEHYARTASELKTRLEIQELNLKELENAAGDLRQRVMEAVATEDATTLMGELDTVFRRVLTALNNNVNGQYIYGGTRIDTPPVNVTSLTDLAAAPTIASIFENNSLKSSAIVDEGLPLEYGFLASDLGAPIMDALQRIKQFSDGPSGPLDGRLDATQLAFLDGELANLKTVAAGATQQSGFNGTKQKELEGVMARVEQVTITTTQFVSDIEDADLGEALTRLSQDQIALQAAARMVAQLNETSLLNFI